MAAAGKKVSKTNKKATAPSPKPDFGTPRAPTPPAPSKAGRRSSIRKAAGPIGPVGISPRRQRREAITREIAEQQDTRKTNREALGFVGDALAKVAEVVTAEPKTDAEKAIAPLTALIPSVGMLKSVPKIPKRTATKGAKSARDKRTFDRPGKGTAARADYGASRSRAERRRDVKKNLRWKSSDEAYANLLAYGLDRSAKRYMRGRWFKNQRLTKKQQSLARRRARWSDQNRSVSIIGHDGYITPPGEKSMPK
jgi:hypothetical protein